MSSSTVAEEPALSRAEIVYPPAFFADEESLLVGLRAGRRGARAVMYRRYVEDVEVLLWHLLGDGALAPTVFEHAFVRLRSRRLEIADLDAWLKRLTVRLASRELRRRRLVSCSSRLLSWLIPGGLPARELVGYQRAGGERVPAREAYRLLGCLPPRVAVVLGLHWIVGLPLDEVADLCDESLRVVRARALRGRAKFLQLAWKEPQLKAWVSNVVGM